MQIPRLIHQTLPDKSDIPEAILNNIERLKTNNPGWRHNLYDDKDIHSFIRTHYGKSIHRIYAKINPIYGAARADLFRYLLIAKFGGVYLDIKSGCSQSFDHWLGSEDTLLLSNWRNGKGEAFEGWGIHPEYGVDNEFENWHIISTPNHPLIHAVIDRVLWNLRHYSVDRYGVGRLGVLRTTGPIAYTKAILASLDQHSYRIFDSHACGLLYSALDSPDKTDHENLFGRHYTQIEEPIVLSLRDRLINILPFKIQPSRTFQSDAISETP